MNVLVSDSIAYGVAIIFLFCFGLYYRWLIRQKERDELEYKQAQDNLSRKYDAEIAEIVLTDKQKKGDLIFSTYTKLLQNAIEKNKRWVMQINESNEQMREIELWKIDLVRIGAKQTWIKIEIPKLFNEDSFITFITNDNSNKYSLTDNEGLKIIHNKIYGK